jgi:hypothetical protein
MEPVPGFISFFFQFFFTDGDYFGRAIWAKIRPQHPPNGLKRPAIKQSGTVAVALPSSAAIKPLGHLMPT